MDGFFRTVNEATVIMAAIESISTVGALHLHVSRGGVASANNNKIVELEELTSLMMKVTNLPKC